MAKEICERCGKVFEAGPNSYYCKKMQECNFKRGGKEEKSKCAGIGSQKEKAA